MRMYSILCAFFIYILSLLPVELKSDVRFFVVIPSYNNAVWAERNVLSVLNQKYRNFQALYVDDCSTDGTANVVEKILAQYDSEKKVTLVRNAVHRGKTANIWLSLHGFNSNLTLSSNDVVVVLDGDDWYNDENVFDYLNSIYINQNVWLTYGGFIRYPPQEDSTVQEIPTDIVAQGAFREFYGFTSQQRTFYLWLYHQIRISDLFYQGKFAPVAGDVAKMFPMFEMAGHRFFRIIKPIYIYNRINTINDDKVAGQLQTNIGNYLRTLERYQKLTGPIALPVRQDLVDTIILTYSHDGNEIYLHEKKLRNCLAHIGKISVLTMDSDQQNFKRHFVEELKKCQGEIILLARSLTLPQKNSDLQLCARVLNAARTRILEISTSDNPTPQPKTAEHLVSNIYACQNCAFLLPITKRLGLWLVNKGQLLDLTSKNYFGDEEELARLLLRNVEDSLECHLFAF